jgi:hypothetical protein
MWDSWRVTRKMAKVYLAGRYDHRRRFQTLMIMLEELGHVVTSYWLTGEHDLDLRAKGWEVKNTYDEKEILPENREICAEWAAHDIRDVCNADVLMFFAEYLNVQTRRGGRMVELGIVIGWNELIDRAWISGVREVGGKIQDFKRVIIVGPLENNFMCLPWMHNVQTTVQAIELLESWRGVEA